jgi:hypothetical protein
LDSLIYGFAGMLVGFLAIYLFLAKKVDRTEYTNEYTNELKRPQSKIASKISQTKYGIGNLRKKSKIIHLFKTLEKKDQQEVIKKLSSLLLKDK